MERQTLRDWVHRYNAEGVAGLSSRVGPGPTPRLNEAQMAALRELVVNGPDPETDKVVRWRCIDLRDKVEQRFSVTVHKRTVAKWLAPAGADAAATATLSSEEGRRGAGSF